MVKSRRLISEQDRNIRIDNEWFENVAKFEKLETTLKNHNDIQDEMKNR
jgi:hypothetical protein